MNDLRLSKETLEALGIYDLRRYGRSVGVQSPTSLKREKLIEEIIMIESGKKEKHIPRAGRPPKPSPLTNAEMLMPGKDSLKVILSDSASKPEKEGGVVAGILEIMPQGYGFLRTDGFDFLKRKENELFRNDVFLTTGTIRSHNLRAGDIVKCTFNAPRENQSPSIREVLEVNGQAPSKIANREYFDDLIPTYPQERFHLEVKGSRDNLAARCIDLMCPIGKGQRGLIVSPPKAGKTTILKSIAKAVEANHPKAELIVLLIDERPEEVTDLKSSVKSKVISSNFDETAEHHIKVAELVISYAKRMVESGVDVVILLDSITRLARAYNTTCAASGKTLSGGLDPAAMYGPKKFFGAARNISGGGSLTIIATALVDTGSRMDDVIYEEFKGTGNMELHLSRELSEKRVFPAIDLYASGTRKEELLLSNEELECAQKIRKNSTRDIASESVLEMMKKTVSNEDLISRYGEWIKIYQRGQ